MASSTASLPATETNHEKLLKRVLYPAVQGQNCPICLGGLEPRAAAVLEPCSHAYCLRCIRKWSNLRRKCPLCNSAFDSWFDSIRLSSRTFRRLILPPLAAAAAAATTSSRSFRRHAAPVTSERRRSRPLPWRRSFGRPGSVDADVIAERKIQWRASIYRQGLQAVATGTSNRVRVSVPVSDLVRKRVLERVEPWVRRELQVLGDGYLSVVVLPVVTSLYIRSLEKKDSVSSGERDVLSDDFLVPLRPFLLERTDMFWHELRCFADSPFNMETYDAVVEYRSLR